jgi:hypothetical protein
LAALKLVAQLAYFSFRGLTLTLAQSLKNLDTRVELPPNLFEMLHLHLAARSLPSEFLILSSQNDVC